MDFETEIVINPVAYYAFTDAAQLLGVSRDRLRTERKAGRLQVAVRGKASFIRGQWLIDWIETAAKNSRETKTEVPRG